MAPKVLIVDDNAELLGLLSSVFENAGYAVVQAQRARQALERIKSEKLDFAVVDVLLPDVIGFEVAAVLRAQKIPFVMMTGVFKGGRHSLDAVQKHGALAHFEKPFEVDRLVEKVASIVPAKRPAPAAEADEPDFVEVDLDDEEGELELTGRVRVTEAQGKVSATLQGEPIRVAPSRPPLPRPDAPPRPPPVVEPATPAAARVGQLADNLPQLISAFYLAQETGELALQRGAVRKTVYFESGAPMFAVSNLSTERLGNFLVRIGRISADDVKAASVVAERSKRRTGDVLIEMGLITDTERMYYVGQQVKAIIYSLFAWEEGTWQLSFRKRAREEQLKLDLHPANLIMRGVKKLYSPVRLARLLPETAKPVPAQDPSYLLSDVELEPWEAHLLARVDGTRSAAELIALAAKPPEAVRGFLVGLSSLRILDLSA